MTITLFFVVLYISAPTEEPSPPTRSLDDSALSSYNKVSSEYMNTLRRNYYV